MRKLFIMVVALTTLGFSVKAQRMIPKQKGLEINAGFFCKPLPDNFYLNLMMTVNGRNGNYRLWGLDYALQRADYKSIKIPLETFTLSGGYSFRLLSDPRKFISLNLGLTAVVGYESVNGGDPLLFDGTQILNESGFVYGADGRLSLELYLSDRLVWLFQGRARALWGTDLNRFRPAAGIGLRFNF